MDDVDTSRNDPMQFGKYLFALESPTIEVGTGQNALGSLYESLSAVDFLEDSEDECFSISEKSHHRTGHTERLSLAYENLQALPNNIITDFGEYIKILDISHNQISQLNFLTSFKTLTSLIADDNPITDSCLIPNLPHLQLLWLNNCGISSLYPWIRKLYECCPNLRFLCLMGNPAVPGFLEGSNLEEYKHYRLFVISHFPRLIHLDDRRISDSERDEAKRSYKRPLFERILTLGQVGPEKVNAISDAVASTPSVSWKTLQQRINCSLSKWGADTDSIKRRTNARSLLI